MKKDLKDALEGAWIIPLFLILLVLVMFLMDFMFSVLA